MKKPSNTSSKPIHRLRTTEALDRGVALVAKLVGVTYGPLGRSVALQRAAGSLWTRDGATIAWELDPEDSGTRLGVRIVQAACDQISKSVGDGTTTAAIVIDALLRQVRKEIVGGVDPWSVAQRLRSHDWASALSPHILDASEYLYAVALSSSHEDEAMAEAIQRALLLTGSQGLIHVEDGTSRDIEVLSKPGFVLDFGWESSELSSEGGPRCLEAPLVALLDGELSQVEDVASVLEEATAYPFPVLLITRGIYGKALHTIVANDRRLERPNNLGVLEVTATRLPHRGRHAWFRDLAALTGATVVRDFRRFDPSWFGGLRRAEIRRSSTILTAAEDATERLENHLEAIQAEEALASSSWELEECKRRAAMISGGMCCLRVGGDSPSEIKERKSRLEDALRAVRVAAQDGVVRTNIWQNLARLEPAFNAPFERILRNAGHDPIWALGRCPDPVSHVFDVRKGEWVSDTSLVLPAGLVKKICEVACSVVAELALTQWVLQK